MSPNLSYSQSGEDLIVKFLFDALSQNMHSFMDVGAYDPLILNNTNHFYELGIRGVNVEPNPVLFERFLVQRKADINLNIGISNRTAECDFYICAASTLSTFQKEEAENLQRLGYPINSVEKIRVDTIQNVIDQYFEGVFPDFLSIDTEGMEKTILESVDLQNNGPKVICCETLFFSDQWSCRQKDIQLIDFIENQGYQIYADTFINTIFVKRVLLK